MNEELKRALRRVEPPAGFVERVLERAARRDASNGRLDRRPSQDARGRAMALWAAAAMLAVAVTAGVWHRAEQRRQAEGAEARRQVLLSLQIASEKLQHVRAEVLNP